ncbi:guanylate kinase [Limosilactobacillus caecicola]|uniref:guanylate kinase n=1 Tax=Limosilactobacillus caecicola TaxID=2941332 RepID=UPI00203FFA9B|nr:AAA family ATPase [Limosilactobacillus caecicola]
MKTGKVFVITGATGSGKTTVARYLQQKYHLCKVITHTTRPPRSDEQNGVDYYFEQPATMKKLHLLEKVEYDHHLYGSSLEGLQKGWQNHQDDVIVLDTKGAITYKEKLGDRAEVIFLTVSHFQKLAQRLKERGDCQTAIKSRLNSDEYERDLALPRELKGKAHVIVNDKWQETIAHLDQIFKR